ncbi:MAG: SDR family NAD(P)-dependent oxidoreductase, partial [Methanomicrobiales archaeon]|nr:SDR family NAD(P)-dependent oxidoreductase [Methanomicrobiales archaeon]
MKWSGKSVLVTGAGGFIGSHLVDALAGKGADVTAFVHYNARNDWGMLEEHAADHGDRLTVVLGDVTDASSVAAAVQEKEIVFHLAALIGIPYSYVA